MKTDQKITITTATNVKVAGSIIHVSEADISVLIRSPYMHLHAGLHIPYFSRPVNSFFTVYGKRTAENLLSYLYDLGHYLEEHEKFIKLQFALHFQEGDYGDDACRQRFFGSTFPFMVPLNTREDVMRRLIK